jgi:DNA-binding MarR family transcriptional regulator
MNLYQRLGFLVLGSRLRRLSEAFLSEITRAYQNEGIDFEASWFPVFYLLSEHGELSIKELSEQIEVSHPAASQLVAGLKNKGLVTTKVSASDGRKQLVTLTTKGQALLEQVKPVWDAILISMDELVNSQKAGKQLLPAIAALETAFGAANLAQTIADKLAKTLNPTES